MGRNLVARWHRWLMLLWSLALALLMLGPALGRGYVLSYDMVWVPDLALRPDFLGLGSGLPRAVPSDAVVAVLDELVPGMLLQKLVLVGMLCLGGLGVTMLVDRGSAPAGLVATTVYQWNPFVAERLVLGHWPVLVGYAAAPWVVRAARTWRETGRMPPSLWLLVPVGSLSASAGVATAVCLLAFLASRDLGRIGAAVALIAAANAPWVVSGLLHAGSAVTDAAGATAFALHAEGSMPPLVALLSLGGVWNAEVVPSSRDGLTGWVAGVLVVGLLVLGLRLWREAATDRRNVVGYLVCAGFGVGVAALGWAAPTQMAWVFAHVPGTGLFRDGSRLLGLAALGLAVLAGSLGGRAARRLPEAARPASVFGLVLLPMALLPDASFGVSGRLGAVDFPADYAAARTSLAHASSGGPDDVLVLPFSSYRQPSWNDGHKVLDPVGRYLTPDYVAADDLFVSGVRVAGEDRRAADAAAALAGATPEVRSRALARLGIAFVATERDAPAPDVAGRPVHEGGLLSVQRLDQVADRPVPWSWKVAMVCAWTAFAGCVPAAAGTGLARRRRRSGLARNEPDPV